MKTTVDISIIITAWKEPDTVGPLIKEIANQIALVTDKKFEVLLVCPDEETKIAAIKNDEKSILRVVQDEGLGKPSALNKVFDLAKGEWWILTDGDVVWDKNVVKEMIVEMVGSKTGGLTGRPVPLNDKNTLFGYWSFALTEMAHKQRFDRYINGRFIVLSGYLMALHRGIIKELPKTVLSDDALISYIINNKGYKNKYVPKAKVYVKFPTNIKDWIKQKARSGGGYLQLCEFIEVPKDSMRSFKNEVMGIFDLLRYSSKPKELFWTILLIIARLYLWIIIFWERKIIKKAFTKTWLRVESTK